MRRPLAPLLACLVFCACKEEDGVLGENGLDPVAYLGLEEGASWVYRDDGSQDPPDAEGLLQARLMDVDEGRVEFRRGVRWADGDDEGWMVWGTQGGISLESWSFHGFSGDESLPMTRGSQESGTSVGIQGWSCTLNLLPEIVTYYATYEHPIEIDCSGSKGIPGRWYLVRDFGLVLLESDAFTLDIVAPW
jgi:hypothetical protein